MRRILLPLTDTDSGEAALRTGILAARAFDAHLAVLHVATDSRDVAPLAGDGLSGALIEELMSATERESARRAAALRARFEAVMMAEALPVAEPFGAAGLSASFNALSGREEDLIAQQARLADLTVVMHPSSEADAAGSDAFHAVLFDSGRPVLIAPARSPTAIGRRICIAWNGTGESASAVASVVPWARRAMLVGGAVRVLASDAYQRSGPSAEELLRYLSLHGIEADVANFAPVEREVGAGLLAAAAAFGADLLSMGAYSHSRLRQLILGGVTRHVLQHAPLPVLMNR